MRLIDNTDLFVDKQPDNCFEEILNEPIHKDKILKFDINASKKGYLSLKKVDLNLNFPDENGYLKYSYEDFESFLQSASIEQSVDGVPFSLKFDNKYKDEEFVIEVTKNECVVKAGHTKGIRRALIYIEDLFTRNLKPLLKIGVIHKQFKVKSRITRSLFTPYFLDGSCKDIGVKNFAPMGYLNRLAHDGVNGIYVGIKFSKVLKSEYMNDYGADEDVVIPVLNDIVQKAKYFGVDVYAFTTEPASNCTSPLFNNHPEFFGGKGYGGNMHLFCPSTEIGKKYIKESITRLFTLVPGLGGMMNISTGEGLSSCGSYEVFDCPLCQKVHKTLGKTLAFTEKLMKDVMKEVAPEAKLISWTYNQRSWEKQDIIDACHNRDKEVYHMVNFEDWGKPKQLGKLRYAQDYWLAYTGPGELIKMCGEANKVNGGEMFAKLQVCSSHEISTVPYVPVPGILYDKFKYISTSTIGGAILSWDFGNFPSLMNKATTELSVLGFYKSKNEFLKSYGKLYYGDEYKKIVKAWKYFEKGYKNYPINLAFEWFGPMQDSCCAPLFLKPVDMPLAGTWTYTEKTNGDRIGECMLNGHTIDEVLLLVGNLCKCWKKGAEILATVSQENKDKNEEQFSVVNALSLIFESGYNFIKFYKLRHLLGTKQGDALSILLKMREIVVSEIENSNKLVPIVEKDKRIGFHSYGYKILPEKLLWRVEELKKLLESEFIEVEDRINNNQTPLPFYFGEETPNQVYNLSSESESKYKNFVLKEGGVDENTAIRAFEEKGEITIQVKVKNLNNDKIVIKPEYNIMFPKVPLWINKDKFGVSINNNYSVPYYLVDGESKKFKFSVDKQSDGDVYSITFNRKTMEMKDDETFRLSISRKGEVNSTLLKIDDYYSGQLIRGEFSPQEYCFFVKGSN